MEFDCGTSVDGARTEARYLVTAERAHLVAGERDVADSGGYCNREQRSLENVKCQK